MAKIGVAPFVMKDVVLGIDLDSYEAHVSQVEFAPSTSQVTWKGLSAGSTFTDQSDPTWVCNLSFAQDWETPDSLSQYLLENAGQKKDVTFKPKSGSGPTFEATLILTPGPIGGTIDAYAVGTVSLGVDGAPVLVPAAI